jgi:micrococcal nuclease
MKKPTSYLIDIMYNYFKKPALLFFSFILILNLSGCAYIPKDAYYARVVYIYDGDTVKLDNGERVRYLGIDTPEMNYKNPPPEYFAEEAKRFNADLVHRKNIRLEFDSVKRDKYNRLLAYVYVDDIFVNAKLIEEGYAKVYIIPPNVKYADDFLELQRKAREAKKGIWN